MNNVTAIMPEKPEENMEVTVQKFEDIRTASVRHVGTYDQCTPAWMTLMMNPAVMPLVNDKALFIGVCHDDPSKTNQCRYDACVSCPDDFQAAAPIAVTVIEGGDYAVYRHTGSYRGLEQVYHDLFEKWLPASGRSYKSGAPTVQIYRNLPINTAEENLITDVLIPLA